MLTRTGAGLQIDAVHARAICDEIGERLSAMLRRPASLELPPRLRHLMDQLAKLDDEGSPSIVPSLDDMLLPQMLNLAASLETGGERDQQPVKRGSRPSCISLR
jgi:hypothetical protein